MAEENKDGIALRSGNGSNSRSSFKNAISIVGRCSAGIGSAQENWVDNGISRSMVFENSDTSREGSSSRVEVEIQSDDAIDFIISILLIGFFSSMDEGDISEGIGDLRSNDVGKSVVESLSCGGNIVGKIALEIDSEYIGLDNMSLNIRGKDYSSPRSSLGIRKIDGTFDRLGGHRSMIDSHKNSSLI